MRQEFERIGGTGVEGLAESVFGDVLEALDGVEEVGLPLPLAPASTRTGPSCCATLRRDVDPATAPFTVSLRRGRWPALAFELAPEDADLAWPVPVGAGRPRRCVWGDAGTVLLDVEAIETAEVFDDAGLVSTIEVNEGGALLEGVGEQTGEARANRRRKRDADRC